MNVRNVHKVHNVHKLRIALFLLLSAGHLALILLPVDFPFAPMLAGSVYLPLMVFKSLGLPVFAEGGSGGWAAPSILGWGLAALVWAGIWWMVAVLAAGLFVPHDQKRKSHN